MGLKTMTMKRLLSLVGILPAVAYAGTPVVYSGCYGGNATAAGPTVIVPNVGKVEGLDLAPCGYPTVNEFRGVPYAQPPVRSLRWQSPQAHPGWGDEVTLKATAYGSSCMQPDDGRFYSDLTMDEDCLFLNIATPKAALEIGAKMLPVMLNIHGGSFHIGMGNQPDIQGPSLVASSENRVVAVAINYRLGVFGFLGGSEVMALSDGGGAESLGIQDQRAAIVWVKANIGAFGGDGDDITIFGESAGGVSILYHLVQPASFPLYKNAIIESGTFLADMQTMTEAETAYEDLLNVTNCTSIGITCLVGEDAKTLLDVGDIASGGDWHPVGYDTPAALIAAKRYNSKAGVIVGSSRDEGLTFSGVEASVNLLLTEAELDNMEPYSKMKPETLNELKRIYSPEAYPYPADLGGYSLWYWMHLRYTTDVLSKAGACSVRWLARMLVAGGSPAVYTYLFAYPPKFDFRSYNGVFVNHGVLVPFVNGDLTPLLEDISIPEDSVPSESKKLARAMGAYWSSFAISSGGDINPSGSVAGEVVVTWPMFTTEGDKVLRLDVESAGGIRVQEGLRKAACDWQTEQAQQDWLPAVASSAKDGKKSPCVRHKKEYLRGRC